MQLIFLITDRVTQSWSRALETEHQGPRPGPGGQRRDARVGRAAQMPKRRLQYSPRSLTKRVSSRLLLQTC